MLSRRNTVCSDTPSNTANWGVLNETFEGVNVRVARNVVGPVYQVHWVADYESLAVFEELWKKVETDAGYQDLLKEVREQTTFIGTSLVDSLYETIS